jgi:TetR/AcrR family transcriptional regulator
MALPERGTRSRPRGADATRARVLDAAATLFARKGLDGVRLREVAEAAGATVPLLCHHFKDKETLYNAVIDRAIERFATMGWDVLRAQGSFQQRLTALVTGVIDLLATDATITELLHRELADGGARARPLAERSFLPLKRAAVEEIRAAQQRGEARADLDPDLLVLHVLGAAIYPSIAAPIVRVVWGRDPLAAPMLEQRKGELVALLSPLFQGQGSGAGTRAAGTVGSAPRAQGRAVAPAKKGAGRAKPRRRG